MRRQVPKRALADAQAGVHSTGSGCGYAGCEGEPRKAAKEAEPALYFARLQARVFEDVPGLEFVLKHAQRIVGEYIRLRDANGGGQASSAARRKKIWPH